MTIPVIETDRLRLRGWEERDFSAYLSHRRCSQRLRFVIGPVSSEAIWEDFCAMAGFWVLRGYGIIAIARRDDDQPIDFTGLWFPPDITEPELCWSLFPGSEGHGYATEAAATARDWAYTALDLPPLMSFIHPDNAPSLAVASRLDAMLESETVLRGASRLVFRHP